MEPRIIEKERIILVGVSFFGDPFAESGGWTEANEIGRLWDRFFEAAASTGLACEDPETASPILEVHVEGPEATAKGHREVFVGVENDTLDDVPVEMLVKVLPASTYAVFTVQGEQITSDWSHTITEWMQEECYRTAYPFGFQLYDSRFLGLDQLAASAVDVYTPVTRQDHVSTDSDR
jgi:predicted transcriptional regulator YdeE